MTSLSWSGSSAVLHSAQRISSGSVTVGTESHDVACTVVLAPTGTIGLVMDCDTTGIEPDFALVKFKKLAGGGYFKIINRSVPIALKRLGYDDREIDEIITYATGHKTLRGSPFINHESLRAKGFTDEELEKLEASLENVFDIQDDIAAQVVDQLTSTLLGDAPKSQRLDEEAYITDTDPRDNTFYNSGLVDRGEDDSWLLGLGHRRGRGRAGWRWSVGVRLRVPPEPYAKLSWLYRKQFTLDTDLRFRQTFFWRSDDGFGTTSRADLTSRLGSRDVLRWEGIVRFTEETQGTDWYLGHTWYHLLPNGSALSLLTFADGETQRPVELKDAGFQLTWRRPFTRDWIYLSLGPSLTWPRRQPEDERKANLGFGVWIEMEFGDWRY